MALSAATIAELAQHLEDAQLQVHDVVKITDAYPDMSWSESYDIQDAIRSRKEARGDKTVGLKAGLTSFAKMKQMGVDVPCFGFVSASMARPDGGDIRMSELIHPKVEAEICIVTKAPLRGPGCHVGAVLAAIDYVIPAVEIIDSRYRDFKFTLPDVVADNSSSSAFFVGPWASRETDVSNLGLMLEVNGRAVQVGSTAAILGHPLRSLVAAARVVARAGERLEPGDIVLAGGATAAHPLAVGEYVRAIFQTLGAVAFTVIE